MSDIPLDPPAEFNEAKREILDTKFRRALHVEEIHAPQRISEYSVALGAGVQLGNSKERHVDSELGTGRFVLLYDQNNEDTWGSKFRVVCYAQAPLEPEIGTDPFIADVAWSWLIDALDLNHASYRNIAGTATNTISTGFGTLAAEEPTSQLEFRASWTPADTNFQSHVKAWATLLGSLSGLPGDESIVSLDPLRTAKRLHD